MNVEENPFQLLSRQLLTQGNSVRFQAHGVSMRPVLNNGDYLTIAPITRNRFRHGDMVLYRSGDGRPFVHRIVGITKKNGQTVARIQGDACMGAIDHVLAENIWGRVVLRERQGKIRRLDSFCFRILGLFLAAFSPVRTWGIQFGIKIRKRLLGEMK